LGTSSCRAPTSRSGPTRRVSVRVSASFDGCWSRGGVLIVRPSVKATGLAGIAWWGQCHNSSGGGVHRELIDRDRSVRDRDRWPRPGSDDARRNEVSSRTGGVSLVLAVEAIVGNTEIITPANRIPRVFRHPTVVQAELVRPKRSLYGAGDSRINLAKKEGKKRYVRTLICFRDIKCMRRG